MYKNVTNGFVWGGTNKIKVIKGIEFVYRNFSNLEKIIHLRIN